MSRAKKDDGHWIEHAKESGSIREGGFHKSMHKKPAAKITMKDISKGMHSTSKKIREQANLAETFKRMRKGK